MLKKVTQQKTIRENLRFRVSSGQYNGEKVFIKTAATSKQNPRIIQEATGLQAMFELDPTQTYYKTPRVIYIDDSTIIMTWVEGKPMKEYFNNETAKKYCKKLRELYIYIDSRTTSGKGTTRINQPGKRNSIDYNLEQLSAINYGRFIDTNLVESLVKYIYQNLPTIETRFTHGDLQPGNILLDSSQSLTIVDCESCSWLWPRHYNIVNFTFNYFLGSPPSMTNILIENLHEYFNKLGLDEEANLMQINFSAAIRIIQTLYEILIGNTKQGQDSLSTDVSNRLTYIMKAILNGQQFTSQLV